MEAGAEDVVLEEAAVVGWWRARLERDAQLAAVDACVVGAVFRASRSEPLLRSSTRLGSFAGICMGNVL